MVSDCADSRFSTIGHLTFGSRLGSVAAQQVSAENDGNDYLGESSPQQKRSGHILSQPWHLPPKAKARQILGCPSHLG
jgi:hypothetical protein